MASCQYSDLDSCCTLPYDLTAGQRRGRNALQYDRTDGKKSLRIAANLPFETHLDRCHHQEVIRLAGVGYFLTWFDQELETILSELWHSSPSSAYALHQRMARRIMDALSRNIPQVREHGCAPLPSHTPELNHLLTRFHLKQLPGGQLNRGHAALTFHPWLGGCTVCALQSHGNQNLEHGGCSGRLSNVPNSF